MSKISSIKSNKKKAKYKITNWSTYNKSLIGRGNISLWIDYESVKGWYYEGPSQRGAQFYYSDECIECLLGLKSVFHLGYRQLEGFANSIMRLMGLNVEIPSYTQINRRARDLEVDLNIDLQKGTMHIVFDSTGLKVYGEGEWKVRKHGYSKRRTWRKLHLGVDEKSGIIYSQVLTENDVDDASQLEPMLDQIDQRISKIGADGAYDKEKCWDLLKERHIQGIIPPRVDAVYWTDKSGKILDYERNKILKQIDRSSRKSWKKKSGYHRRSLSETAMMRFKVIYGEKLYSREFSRQQTETAVKIKMLNKMTQLGMPISVEVN